MTLPQNVKDAVRSIDDSETVAATPHPDCNALVKIISVDDWQTIRARLLSQDAEIERLSQESAQQFIRARDWAELSGKNEDRASLAESRLTAATAEIEQLQAGLAKHVNRVCELQDRLAAANERLEAAERDAARYRWLRGGDSRLAVCDEDTSYYLEQLDAIIDAAAQEGEG